MPERLVGAARKAALHQLHGWTEVEDRDAIRKTYHFGSFVDLKLVESPPNMSKLYTEAFLPK